MARLSNQKGSSMNRPLIALTTGALIGLTTSCAPHTEAPRPRPEPRPEAEATRLPPIPPRDEPLTLRLIHPAPGTNLVGIDSTFIFGSTGTGRAELTIDDYPIEVAPNGAFLAFLPVPEDGTYRLRAQTPTDTANLELEVMTRARPEPGPILESSIRPRGAWAALPGEVIELRFAGRAGGQARLILPDQTEVPMIERPGADPEISTYIGYFTAQPLVTPDTTIPWPTLLSPDHGLVRDSTILRTEASAPANLELIVDDELTRVPLPLNLVLLDPDRPRVGSASPPYPPEGSGEIVGRPAPGYTYTYFWPPGTRLTLTGERGGFYRVALGPDLDAWVVADQVRLLDPATPPPAATVGTIRLTPNPEYVDLRIELDERVPFLVNESDDGLELTLYQATSNTNWILYGPDEPLIEGIEWRQPAAGIYQLLVTLDLPPWGYQTLWERPGELTLRIRRPPTIDRAAPLHGLLIAVDPGHPPAGATGPTGLTEPEANLAIALHLQRLLEERGAEVLMTRSDTSSIALSTRTNEATEASADLLISIHNNAFPDGVNPFENHGTSVFYYHPHSRGLARAIQAELLHELGTPDLGIGRADLALVRPTWMPAVLTESLFMMIPQQEAALRDPSVQERIAEAHLRGIEVFLEEYATFQ